MNDNDNDTALLAQGVIHLLDHEGPVRACAHAFDGPMLPAFCLLHPLEGVMCPGCSITHAGTHGDRLCDGCGDRQGVVWPQAAPRLGGDFRLPDGQVRSYEGRLSMKGVSWCLPCQADRVRAAGTA